MNRVYKVEFGIEGVPIKNSWDDMFEVNIEFSDEEHDQMLVGYEKYFWSDDDSDELFHDYLPELNEKICSLAEPFAVAKWGGIAKRENGAWYEAFPPDEIVDEYMASDNYKEFCNAQERRAKGCLLS